MSKKNKIILWIIIIVGIFHTPFFEYLKSVTVMSFSSSIERKHSVLKEENITLDIPGGLITKKKDWYPLVMTFNASEPFSKYIGRDVKLSILYNFGAFNYLEGTSLFYKPQSEYYTSFYGAYVVKDQTGPFGYYKDGNPNYEEMFSVPEYDMRYLVLASLGCTNPTFELGSRVITSNKTLLGYEDWQVVEGTVITNSPIHQKNERKLSYIQYGTPPKYADGIEAFPLIKLHAKLYARYFEEKQCSIFFYILTPNAKTIKEWESEILFNTEFLIDDNK